MNWDPIESPCDYVLLEKRKTPGLAEVVGASSLRQWDEREGHGVTGSYPVFKSRALAKFSVVIRLYSLEDWADWHAFKPIVDKLPAKRGGDGPSTGKLDIWHPLLETLDIKAVGVAEVGQATQTGDGEWTIEIKFIEWRAPKVTIAKPEAAAAVAPAAPVDPVEAQIEQLTKQFDRLAGGPPPLPDVPS